MKIVVKTVKFEVAVLPMTRVVLKQLKIISMSFSDRAKFTPICWVKREFVHGKGYHGEYIVGLWAGVPALCAVTAADWEDKVTMRYYLPGGDYTPVPFAVITR